MNYTNLVIQNTGAQATHSQPFIQGFPLPRGLLFQAQQLTLANKPCNVSSVRFSELTRWSDGSLKWVDIHGTATMASGEAVELSIEMIKDGGIESYSEAVSCDKTSADHISLQFKDQESRLLPSITLAGVDLEALEGARFEVKDSRSRVMEVVFQDNWRREDETNEYSVSYRVGSVRNPVTERKIDVELRLRQLPDTSVLQLDVQLHNPDAARHPAGVWDLGDAGSFEFSDCSLFIPCHKNAEISWQVNPSSDWHETNGKSISIFQGGSGGPNWNSVNHLNSQGVVPVEISGYVIRSIENEIGNGKRASPAIFINDNTRGCSIQIDEFWQNYPKTLAIHNQSIKVGLFPDEYPDNFELQGGEKKTHTVFINFSEQPTSIDWLESPFSIKLSPVHKIFSDAFPIPIPPDRDQGVLELLENALDTTNGFESKRERIDEYGWRNYGDLYADHETWRYEGNDLFVSHYNNQYDPIYGFARQYIQSGDVRWFKLLSSLARHVIDIDIYHTEKDRAEYNGGLFWHTDHYVKAHTSTHRTYSDHQNSDEHVVIGGGPGGQHCYTNGLTYYYFLTGDHRAKECVVRLEKWIRGFYEGTATLQEWTLNLLRREFSVFIRMLKGTRVLRYQYPLDRGVGNYLRALLDCYELTGSETYLQKAEYVIRNTASPFDNIEERQFHKVESTWYYTIYLQSLIQYLGMKRANQLFDDSFYYARDTLIHYANWMLENEIPYLHAPERLEIPNETWIAQEIRKAHVLIEAYQYSLYKADPMLERAKYFAEYVKTELSASQYRYYTRIVCILLQNDGVSEMIGSPATYCSKSMEIVKLKPEDCYYSFYTHFLHIVKSLGKSLRSFSVEKELVWFRIRLRK